MLCRLSFEDSFLTLNLTIETTDTYILGVAFIAGLHLLPTDLWISG